MGGQEIVAKDCVAAPPGRLCPSLQHFHGWPRVDQRRGGADGGNSQLSHVGKTSGEGDFQDNTFTLECPWNDNCG